MSVTATTTADFSSQIQRRLSNAERKPLRQFQSAALSFISSQWVGWQYRDRPASAPRNVSLAKWKGKIQATEADSIGMTISNEAKSWDTGAPYVGAVERRRGAGSEADKVIGEVIEQLWPVAVEQMAAAMALELARPSKPQRLRPTGGGPTVTAAPLIL